MNSQPYRPKRIVFVIGSLDRGGAEMHLCRVLPRLDRARFNPIVLTTHQKGELACLLEQEGIDVIGPWVKSGARKTLTLQRSFLLGCRAAQLFWHLVIKRPDLVHFFLPASYWIGGPISLLSRRSIKVMSRRSMNFYQQESWAPVDRIEPWLHGKMHAILGNSRSVTRQLIVEEGSPRDRTLLLYNGVTIPSFDPGQREAIRQELGLEPDVIVMTCIANLRPVKGHEDLIRACAKIESRVPWTLLVIGSDRASLETPLKALAGQLGVSDRIRFLGPSRSMDRLLCASDLGVVASHSEGFSNAILEHMAAGLPMVATAVGGNEEAVVHGETGLIVPARAPEEMAGSLRQLIEDSDLRRRMGQAGLRRVKEHFLLDRCVRDYERLYDTLLSGKPTRTLTGLRAEDCGL